MIDNDLDLDIGILEEDFEEQHLTKIMSEFNDVMVRKWEKDRIISDDKIGQIGKIKVYRPNMCFNIWTKGTDGDRYFPLRNQDYFFKIPDKFLKEFVVVDFMGVKVRIPNNSEEYLKWNYGEDWKTPNPDWTYEESQGYIKNARETINKKAVILAAGKTDTKWNNYLDIPKQLIEIGGEVLIKRTIRQLKERGLDVSITLPEKNYLGKLGVKEIICTTEGDPIEKILNLKDEVPCLVVWGDVRFTDEAMDTITTCDKDLMFFGRESAGIIKKCGEPFAARLNSYAIEKAQELKDKGLHSIHGGKKRCGEWELYRYINNISLDEHRIKNYWTEINDLTDDIDTPSNYKTFKEFIKDPLTHIVITRMWYENKKDLLERVKIYEFNLLPSLLNQTEQDFDIGILCNEKHKEIIQDIHPRIIPFFTKKKGTRTGKYWHIFSSWKDITGIKKYDIQTNIDSDDIVSRDFIKVIRDSINEGEKTLIHFRPLLRDFFTGIIKRIKINYHEKYPSACYSLYQPDKKKYIYIGQDSHTRMYQYAGKVITIPEGYYWVNIHDRNDSSTMGSLSGQGLDVLPVNEQQIRKQVERHESILRSPNELNELRKIERERFQKVIENYKLKNPLKYKQKEQELMDRLAQLS